MVHKILTSDKFLKIPLFVRDARRWRKNTFTNVVNAVPPIVDGYPERREGSSHEIYYRKTYWTQNYRKNGVSIFFCHFFLLWLIILTGFLQSCFSPNTNENNLRFRRVEASESGLNFSNQLTNTEVFNILNYPYFYNGGGVAIGDLNGDQLPDIYFSANLEPNALFLNQGNFRFKDITKIAGVAGEQPWSTGIVMADVNADGKLDIYVNNLGDFLDKKGHNELFINQGNNEEGIPQFREMAAEFGLDLVGFSTQSVFLTTIGTVIWICFRLITP
jgi:hypothetical protein